MIRKIFIVAAVIGLIISLYSDIAVLSQSKSATESGDWVYHSYQVSQAIDAVKISVLQAQSMQKIDDSLLEQVRQLSLIVQDISSQKLRADKIVNLLNTKLTSNKYNMVFALLEEMSSAEAALLSIRMQQDDKNNRNSIFMSLFANSTDLLLIFLFLGFFIYEKNVANKLQRKLAKSLMDVESANQKLQMALSEKSSKLRMTVHDLKNPLGSIKGFADLIHEEVENKDSTLQMAAIIQNVSNTTLEMVSALLDEKEQDIIPPENLDVLECLKETCTFLLPMASEKGQKIKMALNLKEFSILAHRHQIQDIFFNVIGNALKFSPKGSTITVEASDEGKFQKIYVKDAGPGFTPDDLTKVFGQGISLSAKPTGNEVSTGLGLYSAKQAIDKVGGKITIQNGSSGGAIVTLAFPTEKEILHSHLTELNS